MGKLAETTATVGTERAKMRDVAQRAGVSPATVSRVINTPESVGPETRDRVREAMAALAYVPHGVGRSLAGGKTGTVGALVLPPPHVASSDEYFMAMLRGVETAADEAGLATMMVVQVPGDPKQERVARFLANTPVDGFVVLGEPLRPHHRAEIRRAGLPLVLLSVEERDAGIWCAGIGSRDASRDAVRHLLATKRTRIAHIGGPPDSHATSRHKLEGYRLAHAECGREPEPRLHIVEEMLHSREGGQRATERLLASGVPFDAIYAADDHLALGALHALHAHELRVPGDVAVVGYGDIAEARYATPPLTSVHVDFTQLGWLAGTLLARALADPATPPLSVKMDTPLIVRRSSGAAGTDTTTDGGGAPPGE